MSETKVLSELVISEAKLKHAMEIIDEYAVHSSKCVLSYWEAGEPTPDGGYRSKYAGTWYQTKPIDNTPACNCGLTEALKKYEGTI